MSFNNDVTFSGFVCEKNKIALALFSLLVAVMTAGCETIKRNANPESNGLINEVGDYYFTLESGRHKPGRVRKTNYDNFGRFFTYGDDNTIRSAGAPETIIRLPIPYGDKFINAELSADGNYIVASIHGNGGVWLVNIETKSAIKVRSGRTVFGLSFSPDGQYVIIGDTDGVLELRDIRSGNLVHSIESGLEIEQITFGQSGMFLVRSGGQGGLGLYAIKNNRIEKVKYSESPFKNISAPFKVSNGFAKFSPNGKYIAIGSDFGEFVVLSSDSLDVVSRRVDKWRSVRSSYDGLNARHVTWKGNSEVVWGGARGLLGVPISEAGLVSSSSNPYFDGNNYDLHEFNNEISFISDQRFLRVFNGKIVESKKITDSGVGVNYLSTNYSGTQINFSAFGGDWSRQAVFDISDEKFKTGFSYNNKFNISNCGLDAFDIKKNSIYLISDLSMPGGPKYGVKKSIFSSKFNDYPDRGEPAWAGCAFYDYKMQEVNYLLGSSRFLRRYASNGNLIWKSPLDSPIENIVYSEDLRYVITLSDDLVFRWYDFNTGSMLWSLNFKYMGKNSPYIFWLPSGHYFSSDGFEVKNIGAVSIYNKNKIAERVGLDKIWDVFNRPDIVKAKLRGEDTRPLIGDLTIEKALRNPPPKVEVAKVADSSNASRLKIPYTITADTGGVAEVRIFQNGKLISSDGTYKDAPGKAYAPVAAKSADAGRYAEANLHRNAKVVEASDGKFNNLRDQLIVRGAPEKKCTPGKAGDPCKGEIDVEVIRGVENTITVVAFNRDNTIQSVPASVSFKSTLPKEDSHLWVFGVGINQFAGISALKNAHKDAQDFICTYVGKDQISKLGVACTEDGKAKTLFKPQNIHVVDALFDSQATKSNILAALDKVARQAKPGDTFVWFVASHGMMDANSNFGIIAHDTQCLNSDCTDIKGHLTSNEILEASKRIKAMKQLVVLDTCHSGGLDAKLSGLYDARVSLLAKNMGLHLYASAQATEAAQDGKPGTNGTFTAQLLEGIKGAAPKNPEGQISVMTLGDYAKQKTVEATQPKSGAKDARSAQTPVIQHFGQDAGLVAVGGR